MAPKSLKRERDENSEKTLVSPSALHQASVDTGPEASVNSTTNFRNVSACNRCRTRKNRCDQKLPRCTGCEKARVKCVGFDPVSKRTIPRSYVYYLETRVSKLEELLQANNIPYAPPEDDFAISDAIRPGVNVPFPVEDESAPPDTPTDPETRGSIDPTLKIIEGVDRPVRDVGTQSVQGATEKRDGAFDTGISFARVVFAAVRSTVPHAASERGSTKVPTQAGSEIVAETSSTRDSFFGLHTRPAIAPAPFPKKDVGKRLADLYFEYANPQIPILHRNDFMSLFHRVYDKDSNSRTPRELYLLNIIFAIGSGIFMDSSDAGRNGEVDGDVQSKAKRIKTLDLQYQPEEYHCAAAVHLENFLGSAPTGERGVGGLEELQAVCLLAGLALLRPVAPGLWYIVGVAVRLAVDLGLHSEDVDPGSETSHDEFNGSKGFGRKQWIKDLRRRLWWCVYSLDRLVSTCVGRPFGITDQVVTTEFPSLLDDQCITMKGFDERSGKGALPTYKVVAHHYFRLRLLQSEILQVLQHRQAEQSRSRGTNHGNSFIHNDLISPFAGKFASFQKWRADVDRRLWEWKECAPRQEDIGVAFTPLFLELNYWQAVILLYRQSLAVPEQLAELTNAAGAHDVQSPGTINERREDEEMVLMKVAQAGQTVLKLYRQLHRLRLVNYTYLATHHLFMSGISFLHAIWHSPLVRSQLTLDDVDFTVLIATSVLEDLAAKCPPAEACRDAFVRMAKATIATVEKSTGFGKASTLSSQRFNVPHDNHVTEQNSVTALDQPRIHLSRPTMPQFDMDLKALFSDDEIATRPLAQQFKLHTSGKRSREAQAGVSQIPSSPIAVQRTTQQLYQHNPHSASPRLSLPDQTLFQPLTQTVSQPLDFTFDDDISFLDSFPISNPSGTNGWNDFDIGFATGGTGATGWDSGVDWNGMGGSVDMFDGFFFGGDVGNGEFG